MQDVPEDGAEAQAAQQAQQGMAPEEAMVHAFLLEAFAAGTEGLMLKALDGPASGYQPSRRSESWLKIKKCAQNPCSPCMCLLDMDCNLHRSLPCKLQSLHSICNHSRVMPLACMCKHVLLQREPIVTVMGCKSFSPHA